MRHYNEILALGENKNISTHSNLTCRQAECVVAKEQ